MSAASATTHTTEYRTPTVGLEDQVLTFGKVKYAAKFEVVKEEFGKHFSTQTCNNRSYAAQAFETSKDPIYIEPAESPLPTQFVKNTNTDGTIKSKEDSEYKSKAQ